MSQEHQSPVQIAAVGPLIGFGLSAQPVIRAFYGGIIRTGVVPVYIKRRADHPLSLFESKQHESQFVHAFDPRKQTFRVLLLEFAFCVD
jgi:hypothetical protein